MHIHILGIAGTFMAGIALLARALGHRVTGSDAECYPPMSTLLRQQGVDFTLGYHPSDLDNKPDLVIVGNAMSRGKPIVEALLNQGIPYISGPQWLYEHILAKRNVLAVSGTHGKTTTSSMLAWILHEAGLNPSFLIGGVPGNFSVSAQLNVDSPYFVIEADEYDSAFFDKRSKFIHYHPQTLIINNLEFDHADIFNNLEDIQKQFEYLVRTIPQKGAVIYPHDEQTILDTLQRGCWSKQITLGAQGDWQVALKNNDGSCFSVIHQGKPVGEVTWNLFGLHNVTNALAAIAAASHVGVEPKTSLEALKTFIMPARRLQRRGFINNITLFDDFAHHPSEIKTTLAGLRSHIGGQRIIAVLECRSYTMRKGVHKDTLAESLDLADLVHFLNPMTEEWDIQDVVQRLKKPAYISESVDEIIRTLVPQLKQGDHVVVMSNGGFGGIHEKLLENI